MSKKELSIKIDYLSIVFDTLKADELIRKVLGLPLEYNMIQKAKVKHKDYTNLYQFGTIKVYGDRQLKDGTSEAGCYLVLSGQGCDDYYSFLQTSQHTYSDFFSTCIQMVSNGNFHLTRLDIAIDDKNEIPYFTIEQIKRKCLKDEFVSKSKSYRFAESGFDEDTAKTVYIGDGKSNISYRFYDKDKEQAGKHQLPYEEMENWKRTELQLRDEMAHSFAILMCETFEELGILAFDLLSSSLRFVAEDKTQSNKSRWRTSRFWERFLGAVKAFLFLEKYNALGDLKDVQEMMNGAGYSVTLKQKLVSHLYRIGGTELITIVNTI